MLNLDTLEVIIELNPKDPWSEILIAELSESGFDSFVQTDNGIIAYANASLNADEVLQNSSLKLDKCNPMFLKISFLIKIGMRNGRKIFTLCLWKNMLQF